MTTERNDDPALSPEQTGGCYLHDRQSTPYCARTNLARKLPWAANMVWTIPQYKRQEVNEAGKVLTFADGADDEELWDALVKINNWRSSHSFPLNTLQTGLRKKARQVDKGCLIAQRIKRLTSITAKLERFPAMKLSQMQDIGGCRAIVKDVKSVRALVASYEQGKHKHKLTHADDYIECPQSSGYRGVHLIYKYFSDKNETYNDLKIELQIRSQLQHAWATAVETVGTFIQQALKSSQGEKDWLHFFSLMGSAIAIREGTPAVPGIPAKDLRKQLSHYAKSLDVANRLRAYGSALQTITSGSEGAHYFLLYLDPAVNQITVSGFKANELEMASSRYLDIERQIKGRAGADAVLVSVESLDSLRRAYPNYFLDTAVFISALTAALK